MRIDWKRHLVRVGVLFLVLAVLLGVAAKLTPERSVRLSLAEVPAESEVSGTSANPCTGSSALEWALQEYGVQGCWVIREWGQHGLRVLLALEESDEFRKQFAELGPNKLVPVLAAALADPTIFKLLVVEDKGLEVGVRAPVQATKKRLQAAKEAWQNGEGLTGAARAVSKSSGTMKAAFEGARQKYTAEQTVALLLWNIEKGGGAFLDQFRVTRGNGEAPHVDVRYIAHGVQVASSFLTDGLANFEKKYRWESSVTAADAGWAALDLVLLGGPLMKVAKVTKVTKAAKVGKPVAVAKTTGRLAKVGKVAKTVAVVGGVGYAITHPLQSLRVVGDAGTWILSWFLPPWLASLLGPFLGVLVALWLLYAFCWPAVWAMRSVKRAAGLGVRLAAPPARAAGRLAADGGRWLFPRKEVTEI